MAKRVNSPEAVLERLATLRQSSASPEFTAELRRAIAHASPVVVTRAAELACRYNRDDLIDDLVAAFERCQRDGAADKQFTARNAVARALIDLSATTPAAEDAFLSGTRTFGPRIPPGNPDDQAADLRAACALGLSRCRYPDALTVATDLLADPAPIARAGAARALAAGGSPAAALLLRLKLRVGDAAPEVLADCATELIALDPAAGLEPVAALLRHEQPAVRAAAAVALGSPRVPGALDRLRAAFGAEREEEVQQAILAAVAATRAGEAIDWLIGLARSAKVPVAVAAVEALGPYRQDESVCRRVAEIVEARRDPKLASAASASLGPGPSK